MIAKPARAEYRSLFCLYLSWSISCFVASNLLCTSSGVVPSIDVSALAMRANRDLILSNHDVSSLSMIHNIRLGPDEVKRVEAEAKLAYEANLRF